MKRFALSVLVLILACPVLAAAPPGRLWIRLDTGALVPESQVADLIFAGYSPVRYVPTDPAAPVIVGLKGAGAPAPASDLGTALRDAYQADSDPEKAAHVQAIAEVYEAAVGQVAKSPKSPLEFARAIHAAVEGLVGQDGVKKVRDAYGAYLNDKLPRDPKATWTDAARASAAAEFGNVAKALRGLK